MREQSYMKRACWRSPVLRQAFLSPNSSEEERKHRDLTIIEMASNSGHSGFQRPILSISPGANQASSGSGPPELDIPSPAVTDIEDEPMPEATSHHGYPGSRLSIIPEADEAGFGSGSSEPDAAAPAPAPASPAGTDIEDEPMAAPIVWAQPHEAVPSDDKCSIWKLHFSCEDCKVRPPKNSCVHQEHFDNLPVYGIWQCRRAREAHYERIAHLNDLVSQSRVDESDCRATSDKVEHPKGVMCGDSCYSSSFIEWPEPGLNDSGLVMKQCRGCDDVPSPFRRGEIPWLHIQLYGCRDSGARRASKLLDGTDRAVFRRDNLVAQVQEVLEHFHTDRLVGLGGRKNVVEERGYHWLHLNLFNEEVLKHASAMHDMVEPWKRCAAMGQEHVKLETDNQRSCQGDGWFVPGVPTPPRAPDTGEIPILYRPE